MNGIAGHASRGAGRFAWVVAVAALMASVSPASAQVGLEIEGGARDFSSRWNSEVETSGIHLGTALTLRFSPLTALVASASGARNAPQSSVKAWFQDFQTYDYAGGLRIYPFGSSSPNDGVYLEAGAGEFAFQPRFSKDVSRLVGSSPTYKGALLYGEVGYRWRLGGSAVWFSPRVRSSWVTWNKTDLRSADKPVPEVLTADAAFGFGR